MWIRKREWRRLLQQVGDAQKRVETAEQRLEAERQRNDKVTLNILDRFFTSQIKTYAVSPDEPQVEVPVSTRVA